MKKNIRNFLFNNITNRQTFTKNAFWLAIGNIGGRLVRAAIIIYAARVLGAAGWGVFSYGITLVAFLTIFGDIGIDAILTRESAKAKEDQQRRNQILSTALFIKLFLLTAGVLAVLFIAPLLAMLPGVRPLLPLMAVILVFDTLRNFGFSIIRSREKMEFEAGLYLLTNLAIVSCGFLFLYLHPTVNSFTISYAVGTGIGLLATLYALKHEVPKALFHFSRSLVKEILGSAWPFAISGVLGLLMLNTDIVIIGWFQSAEKVGFYSAAVRIIQLLYIFAGVAAQSSLPIFSRFVKGEPGRIKNALENMLKFGFSFSLPMALGGIIAGGSLIQLIFGSEYLPATRSFQILILTLGFNFVAVILSNVIFVYNRQKALTLYAGIGGILNVGLDLLLIPKFGINGSAMATLASQIVADSYLWFIAWRIVRFNPYLKLQKIILGSIFSSLGLLLLLNVGVPIIVAAIAAVAIYLGSLHLLKEPILKEAKAILRTEQ